MIPLKVLKFGELTILLQEDEHAGPDGYKVYSGHDSVCNYLKENKAIISVKGSVIIMQPGLYSSQALFHELDYKF